MKKVVLHVTSKFTTKYTFAAEEKLYYKKALQPIMAKKAIDSGTKGKKNKVNLTGTNKVPILDKCPVDKSPPAPVFGWL